MQPPPAELDPRVSRFAAERCSEMSANLVADILGISRDAVYDLCAKGRISARELRTGKNGLAMAHTRWSITAAATLRYIVHTTTGDKTLVLEAIRECCPQWIKHAKKWAQEGPELQSRAGLRLDTLNTLRRALKAPQDPFAGHPDLFPGLPKADRDDQK